MNKTKRILSVLILAFFLIIVWYLCITYAFSFGVMNMISFIYFHIPALMCFTFVSVFALIMICNKSHSIIKIAILIILCIFSVILFLAPSFTGSMDIVVKNKNILNCLSIENSLKTDYITKDEQYYSSDYERCRIGDVFYISSSYEIGENIIANEELKEDSTEIEYSIHYIKNVPSIIYNYWQKPAIFDLLYEKKARFGYSLEEEFEFKSNDDLVNYKVYYTEETDNKCKIVIYAENGQDMLIYHMKLDDDLRLLIIDKEHIISLIEDVMSGTIK